MKFQTQLFDCKDFGKIEVLFVGDKPFFPATACARILGYAEPEKAIRSHCKGVSKMDTPSNGGIQKVNYIPEGDLYRLIVRSKLPAAERFEQIVFDEILPSIRKHGIFVTPETLDEMLNDRQYTDDLLNQLREGEDRIIELEAVNYALETLAVELTPKAKYCDMVLKSGGAVQISIIAKDYGRSAADFNKMLHNLRIQFKVGETWLLYQAYAGKGYTKSRTFWYKGKAVKINTLWTEKGRMFLYDTLKKYGILPLVEMG